MELTLPYKDIEQYTRIKILPYQLNSDIRNNMFLNLKKKVEKKCNKNGFIDEVYEITQNNEGRMYTENLSGNVIYDVSYHCRMCIPIENTIIIVQIRLISQDLIMAVNGPIVMFISRDNVDSSIWCIEEDFTHNKNKTKLKSNDYVKVRIIAKRINNGDSQIKTIGKLLDYANEKEIEKYYGSIISKENNKEVENNKSKNKESNFII